jgi:hypothetical protein
LVKLSICKLARAIVGAFFFIAFLNTASFAVDPFQKLTAGDAAANDNFGYSVGISGNTAIVGAWNDDRPAAQGEDTGSAYIFRSDIAGNWVQTEKLHANDAMPGNSFGSSVAIDGNSAVIGALFKGGSGGAYIFRDDGSGDWIQADILAANDAASGDEFGYSAAISGNTAVVGAWKHDSAAGAAYVFRDNGLGDWTQIGKLVADDAMAGDHFGVSVAISGTTALVGSYFDSNASGAVGGAVYVFEEVGGTWTQVDKLLAGDASSGKQFGASVALSGTTAVIGATGDATQGPFAGAAYIFERDESMMWQEVDKLTAGDGEGNDLFGFSVGISGNNALVGAYQDNERGLASGSAYRFSEETPGNWSEVEKLSANDGASGDALGYSVGISGGVGIVGAALNNSAATDAGAAYLFDTVRIAGDYNRNGRVDAADYVLWRKTDGQTGTGLPADGNDDGMVDNADYQLWRMNFGSDAAAGLAAALSAAAVPEPATAALLCLAWIGATFARRRSR